LKIAAIGDIHCGKYLQAEIHKIFARAAREADVLVMAGDLTNVGLVDEIEILLSALKSISIPKVAVLGNHDHQSDQNDLLSRMLEGNGICVLDCGSCEIDGVGFVGTKGFCGGFGKVRIQPFGERAIKAFVETSINETVRIDDALKKMNTPHKIAILHYSPVKATLKGESPELFPFLGSSLMADALDRHRVNVVFHGHAHHGSPQGATPGGIPVHNVSRFVQKRSSGRDYFIYEV